MRNITLTTDFGSKDYYAAVLKGAMLRRRDDLRLIDVSHQIPEFDIIRAAFTVKNVWPSFPEGSIHVVAVNNFYDRDFRFLALQRAGHFFLAPDNGVLSLIFHDLRADEVRVLDFPTGSPFPLSDLFADATAHLALGLDFEKIGAPAEAISQRITLQPVTLPNHIRGAVIHVDHFENVVLNVSRELFEKVGNGRGFSLFYKRNDPITCLSNNYCDVPIGEPLCLFNSAGLLEIAIHMGRAASLLGLKPEDVVQLDFG